MAGFIPGRAPTTLPGATVRLSEIIRDPDVRAAFWRAERDDGTAYAVPAPAQPVLVGGEAAKVEVPEPIIGAMAAGRWTEPA